MGIITTMRQQDAVYWAFKAYDAAGNPTTFPPVPIKCRWTDKVMNYSDSQGENRQSKSVIYVDRDMLLDGFLWLGEITAAPFHPKDQDGALQIRRFDKLRKLNKEEYLRTAYV